jgi:hypothetical protein
MRRVATVASGGALRWLRGTRTRPARHDMSLRSWPGLTAWSGEARCDNAALGPGPPLREDCRALSSAVQQGNLVEVAVEGGVATLTLNDNKKRNALSTQVICPSCGSRCCVPPRVWHRSSLFTIPPPRR